MLHSIILNVIIEASYYITDESIIRVKKTDLLNTEFC